MTDERDIAAVLDTLRSGWLTMGPRIQAFEAAFAELAGAPHAIAVSSGTTALHLACRAVGLGPGDEVIVPALGSRAAVEAPRRCAAAPVVADVTAVDRPWLSAADAERRITDRTRAVIAVHVHGELADLDELRALCADRGLALIEDARQACGAAGAGTVGAIGCFSFADGLQLSVGEGGMVVTADEALAAPVRSLRSHAMTSGTWDRHRGHHDSYDIVDIGFNFRMDEPRAALGLSRLGRLKEAVAARRARAGALRAALSDHELLVSGRQSSPIALGVLAPDPDTRDAWIAAAGGQLEPFHGAAGEHPNGHQASRRLVRIPIGPDAPEASTLTASLAG